MNEVKEAFKGQIGHIGYHVAGVCKTVDMSFRLRYEDPFQICVRVEKETVDAFYAFCEKKGVKPLGFAGMIMDGVLKEVLEYYQSFEDLEAKEAQKAVDGHKEDEKKASTRKKKCLAGKDSFVNLRDDE